MGKGTVVLTLAISGVRGWDQAPSNHVGYGLGRGGSPTTLLPREGMLDKAREVDEPKASKELGQEACRAVFNSVKAVM